MSAPSTQQGHWGENAGHRDHVSSADELVKHQFVQRSSLDHRCNDSMRETIHLLAQTPSVILETGTSALETTHLCCLLPLANRSVTRIPRDPTDIVAAPLRSAARTGQQLVTSAG